MEKLNIRRAVVTGCTGAVGTALVKELTKRGAEVLALCRKSSERTSRLAGLENVRRLFPSGLVRDDGGSAGRRSHAKRQYPLFSGRRGRGREIRLQGIRGGGVAGGIRSVGRSSQARYADFSEKRLRNGKALCGAAHPFGVPKERNQAYLDENFKCLRSL